MKAAVFKGAGQKLAIETVDDPKPGALDVVIKVHRCGICGTDLHLTSGHAFDFQPGLILGHEYVGEIIELGKSIEGFKKGDVVTALPSKGCGHCAVCARGNPTLCTKASPLFGGFGEYLRADSANTLKLPSTLSAGDGALVEPLAVGLHGVRMAAIQPGDRVLVQGAGTVALTAIFWARRLGAGRIVAISRAPRRAALALEMGADAFVQSGETALQEAEFALGGSPDIVFECVGVPGFLQQAIHHVRVFGKVLCMGFCIDPDSFIPAMAGIKGVQLSFPIGYTMKEFQYAADTMHAGRAEPEKMVSSVIALDELPDIFEMLRGPSTETKVQVSLS